MSPIIVKAKPHTVHIHADRRLAFQVLTAFGTPSPEGKASSKVLSRDGERLLVEFHTPVKDLLGRTKVHRTVEWVTPHEPEAIDFEGVEGPVHPMIDRFTLEAQGNCTLLRYDSRFGLKWGVLGWAANVLVVRPIMHRFMRSHLRELKETIEARARRSRLYPQQPCALNKVEATAG